VLASQGNSRYGDVIKVTSKPVKKKGKQIRIKKVVKPVNQEKKEVNGNLEPYAGKIDLAQAIKLRYKNKLSYEEIGKHFNCTAQAVHSKLQTFMNNLDDPEMIQSFEEFKPEILSSVERKLISKILDSEKLEKANLNNVAYAFTQIHTANRLQRGQSTTITDDVDHILQRIESRFNKAIDITPSNDNK
jgi:predicted DNA-binding protein YlxM (UPF0122 family)